MAKFKPDDVARRCLCIDGVPGDVQLDEIRAVLTGMLDYYVSKNEKHVFLFKEEQAAKLQLEKTPTITLKRGKTPVYLHVNLCKVDDINTSWLYPNHPMEEDGTIYVNAAAVEEPLYQNPAQLGANCEQTFEWNRGNNPNQHRHQNPINTSATHPPPGMDHYGPHPNQGYQGQYGFQQPGHGQNTYQNQDGNPQNPHVPNPPQFPHGPWYGPSFPPYFQPGMGYPSPSGMQDRKDQQVPPQFNPWGWMQPQFGVQMPNASETSQGSGYPNQQVPWFLPNFGPQHPQQFQYGSPPPYESSTRSSSKDQTEVKSAVSDAKSDDSNTETKLPHSLIAESPPKKEIVSAEDVTMEEQDELPEAKKKKQEGQGGTGGEMLEKKEPWVKQKEQDEPIRKIKVTKLPEGTTEDTVKNFFENRRRNGGGPIKTIEYHPATSSAIIEFQEAETVPRVLKKVPFLFLKKQISVEEYVEDVEEEKEKKSCRTIEVHGFAENTQEEVLEMYFENSKRSGGGQVTSVVTEGGVALVTFADERVVSSVLERKHTLDGQELSVTIHLSKKKPPAMEIEEEEEEQEPVCTVEVRGYKIGSENTLELYFENERRSGGGEISNFDLVDTDEVIFITFTSEEVAKRVVSQGQHKVEGQSLEVKLYIPPPPRPTYENRVLLAGLSSKVTQDGLTNFLEAKTGLNPVTFLYGEDKGRVIITFEETIDFEKLEEACKKRPLEGSYLQPSKVHVSNCIIISNLKITTTEDTIEFYFENEKRSLGGPVQKVEFNREEEYCLVFFEDHTICDRVLHRKHKIDGSDLQLSMYYECLGPISDDDNGPSFKTPKPVKLEGLEFAKIQFLMKSEPNRTAIEKQLQDCFTHIQWPQTETDCITLTCTLTSDIQDCKKKAVSWAKQAEQSLHNFLKVISVHERKVFQEIFETVLKNLQNLVISNPDGVALFVKNALFSIQVVGHKAVATDVVKDIDGIIKKAEDDFDRKKKQTKESLTNLKYHQLKLLLAQKYPSKMEQKYNELKVKINLNKNEIVFEGLMEDIKNAQVAMYETVHSAAVSQLKNIPEGCLHLFRSKEVKDYIVTKLKSKKLVGVWEIEGTNLNIYADSDEAVVKSSHIIKESVQEHQRDLEDKQRSVVQSQQWKDKMKDLDKQYQGKFNVVLAQDLTKLFLYFTDDILGAVIEEVSDFLSQNTIFEKIVTCKSGTIQLIEKRNKDEIDRIAKELTHYYVQIIIQSKGGFLVQGNQDGINQASYRLQELIDKVQYREHELKKPGIAGYMMEGKGQEHISAVETQIPCVIQIKGQEQCGLSENEEETKSFDVTKMGTSGLVIQAECKSFSGEIIATAYGDITDIDADVLVNAADPKLEHRGGLAKAIVDKGGRVISEECRQHVRKNGQLSEGGIHVTSAGNLRAKIIIHAVSPVWKGGSNNEDETLRETIWQCMETTAKQGFKSIAIPALGSGIFGCPVKLSTRVIAETVRDFFREEQDSPISKVYLSDIKPQTVRCFTEALENCYGRQCMRDVKQRPKPTPSPRSIKASRLPGAFAVLPSMSANIVSVESSSFGNITIKVVKGEMASQRVDVFVNTVAKSLDLTQGAVSQSLLKQGGQTLQDECTKSYPNGIKDGDIAVTGGGNLTCKRVCHVALVQWNDPAASLKMLHGLMKKCLDQCEKGGFTSIAFPALGTGNLNYPRDIVAKEMFQHISTYSKDNPSSSVTEVRFVVYQKDSPTIKAFESEQQKWTSSAARIGTRTSQNNLPVEDSVRFDTGAEPMDTNESSESVNSFTFGNIIVKIDEGDITQDDADCIVNSSNEDLDLTRGAVAKAIAQKGGRALVDEARKKADDMKQNGIAVTKGHGLNCKHVIHVVAADDHQWTPVIKKCLMTADQLQAKSVAFPALGTSLGVSAKEIAGVMFKAITDFQASTAKTLQEVRIIIFQSQMVKAFIQAAQNQDSGAKPKGIFSKIYRTIRGAIGSSRQDPMSQSSPHLRNAAADKDSTVWINIFAFKKIDLDLAIQKLEQLINKDFDQNEFTDSVIKRFSSDQVSRLHKVAQEWEVQLEVNLNHGKIKIEGMTEGIMKVSDGIHKLIREAEKKEQEKKSAEMLKKLVQWYFIEITTESSELREYPPNINLLIENSYKDQTDKKAFVTFSTNDGVQYKIDFVKMEEFPVNNPKDTVTVIRKDLISEKGVFELPATWSNMGPNENLKVVNLQSIDLEYQDIQKCFLQSVGSSRTVSKVERIQNKTLYQQYEAKKKLIEQNNPGHPNENLLWHGTSADTVDSINMHGFNRSYCGKNAVAYGNGVYFARNATYSANDTYSKPDATGTKKMYRSRVLTGKYTLGAGGMRVPPAKSPSTPNDLFDSVVNNIQNPDMFIIFNDTQAYPEYLITFK
ncbi:hypothetical protein CHS0354_019799 [Potamilus streckersoni]|uniref:Poly [ADP-ribose] polymerase n=1 Tax=Potamilus streckersoni TaxID=2493646 RepID=A0AAE0W1V9_9BIVA|nr:hypothetical protein CHS0354_019799 [Potamilus streckersoni]